MPRSSALLLERVVTPIVILADSDKRRLAKTSFGALAGALEFKYRLSRFPDSMKLGEAPH